MKRKKSSQPTTARDTSSESHSEANLVDLMPCLPSSLPCSALQPPCYHQAVSHGTCQWHCLYIYLVRCSLLSSKQEVQQKMSP